ncbi:hypothetical protein BDV06DRAFT_194130 [Aspergillus oleicola]
MFKSSRISSREPGRRVTGESRGESEQETTRWKSDVGGRWLEGLRELQVSRSSKSVSSPGGDFVQY